MDIGVVFYYLVFVILLPVVISSYWGFNSLRFYLPDLEAFALVMATIEQDNLFNGLYEKHSETAIGLISTSIIIFLTLYGVIWQNLYFYKNNGNLNKALLRSSIMIFTVFLIPAYLIPYSMEKIHQSPEINDTWKTPLTYFVGIAIILILAVVEYYLIKFTVD